jgi:predicted amidophosphoribosyltransferase
MLSKLEYGTLLTYCPRGTSENALKSKTIVGQLKNGMKVTTITAVNTINNKNIDILIPFFDNDVTFIPIPRSSPLKEGSLWPTKIIAETFIENGFGSDFSTCLNRKSAVKKSSLQTGADSRPSIEEHYNSLIVTPTLITTKKIVLIDDVLTLGRTSFACALKIKEAFGDKDVKLFAMMRTRSFGDNNVLLDPEVNFMNYNENSGKVQMPN